MPEKLEVVCGQCNGELVEATKQVTIPILKCTGCGNEVDVSHPEIVHKRNNTIKCPSCGLAVLYGKFK